MSEWTQWTKELLVVADARIRLGEKLGGHEWAWLNGILHALRGGANPMARYRPICRGRDGAPVVGVPTEWWGVDTQACKECMVQVASKVIL